MNMDREFRQEHDLLGSLSVPVEAYYGIQTLRARQNFSITGVPISHFPHLIRALAMVKQAACRANERLGLLPPEAAAAIERACTDLCNGELHDQFIVDVIQGGAGTSTNMNANEVIANRALEILGHAKGDYCFLHPNNHVNRSQSTNDTYPTAARLAIIFGTRPLVEAIQSLRDSLLAKSREFADVVKMGRTQLQDAVPMTLGQEFQAFAVTLQEDIERINQAGDLLREVPLGGTAIGTGINTPSGYADLAVGYLEDISGEPLLRARHLVEATSDTGAFVLFAGVLKRLATKLSKMSNDLRFLSSGPRAGIHEINLPPVQPGSSMMPGKINPVIPEAVNQTAFRVIGHDVTVTMAAQAGQLQLNAMVPVILYCLLDSMKVLTEAVTMLDRRCITGITANREHCLEQVQASLSIITVLTPYIGYDDGTRIAKKALESGKGVVELVVEEGLLDEVTVRDILKREAMLRPI